LATLNQALAALQTKLELPGDLTHVEFIGGEQVKFRSIALGCSLRMHGAGESSATVPASPTVLTNLSTSEIVISSEPSGRASNTQG
jgi:hypothetical protein